MATGLGIDIGAEFIKVVQAKVSGGAVTVTGALKIPRKMDIGVDLPDDVEGGACVVPENLGEELKRAGLRRSGTVGISGREVILKYLALPPMPADKLQMAVNMEVGGRLTAKAGSADGPALTYDYRLLNIPSGLRGDLILMAGVCKNEFLFGVDAGLRAAKLSANRLTPSCFGLVNAYLKTQKIAEKETVVLVDVGHELLEIAILEENHLYFARSAPGGGKKFTAALDKVLKVGAAKAAEYKKERAKLYPEGAQIPSKQELMFQSALKEGAENIAGAIRSSVMFCRTQAKLPKLDYNRVILSGGGARLNGLREYLEKKLGRPVQVLDLKSSLDLRKLDAASAGCFDGEVPDMSIALGLAIIDADPSSFHFSLLPEKIVRRQNFMRKTVFGIAAGIVMVLGLIPPVQNSGNAVAAGTGRVEFFEEQKQKAKEQKKEFEKRLQENQRLAQKTDYYARQTRMARIYVQLYSKIREETPADVLLAYLGPSSDNPQTNTGAGTGSWNAQDDPVREFLLRGHYQADAYPGVKFNEAWEGMRKKLLEVPGVRTAELEPVPEEADAAQPNSKSFQVKIYLQDDSKPLSAVDLSAPAAAGKVAPAKAPVKKPAAKPKP